VSLAKDFRDFILRGNVVDLAVGVVIGAAFTGVVTAFTKGIITPLIGVAGKIDLSAYKYTLNNSTFLVGDFLNAIITFLITSFVVYFFVVRPVNFLMSLKKPSEPEPDTTRECPECLSKIPIKATRCAFCTATVS
jgi:large conductance mechanosensitive channel